jgi:glycerophosphoryl diester phosphodiesterase
MPIFVPMPVVVGHRGAPRRAAENSAASFRAAAAEGAAWVELDARRTADDRLAVIHDPVDPHGRSVVEQTADELAAQGIAMLDELLPLLPAGLGVDIELKNLPGEPDFDEEQRLAALVVALLAAARGTRPLLASSFNPLARKAVRDALSDIPVAQLTPPGLSLAEAIELAGQFGGADGVFPHASAPDLDAATIAAAHERGLAVMVWTVDDTDEAVRLARTGVDAICTTDPAGVAAALARDGLLRPRS